MPLTRQADARLADLADSFGVNLPDAKTLLAERASLNGYLVPSLRSAGGGCQFYPARDGVVALNLSRPEDLESLPALFSINRCAREDVAPQMAHGFADAIVAQGRLLGMAISHIDEAPASPALQCAQRGQERAAKARPLVIDLSALWAGPLAAHLLWLGGAEVVKIESRNRPDSMREGDPALFDLLNQGKANVALDLRESEDRAALIALIRKADIVIEAARPRALLQLGIDADALVRETPGLVWTTITAHGIAGDAANWIGFGDDTAVAGGLSAALLRATGKVGFVGDAIADPLTGIAAAHGAAYHWQQSHAARLILSMSAVVAEAIAAEPEPEFDTNLLCWAKSVGEPFPATVKRASSSAATLGADARQWVS